MERMASAPPTVQWRISLCGRLAVERDGASLTQPLPGRQGRALFAYLVLNRWRDMTRDELEAVAWPVDPPASPRAGLSTLLTRLRRVLGDDALSTGGGDVRLELSGSAWIDVEAAASLAAEALQALHDSEHRPAIDRARQALALTEGPLLPEVDAPWLEERRRELDELRLATLEVVADAGLALGGTELAAAERAAATLVRRAAYRETGYALLMRCLATRGDTAEALRVFERLRALLRDELGTIPSPALIALHGGLLAGNTIQPHRPPTQPRVGATDGLRERKHELAVIEEVLADARSGAGGLAVLRGVPGIGKTALLQAAAASGAAQDLSVHEACAVELESGFEWGVVRQLLGPGARARGPEPAARMRGAAALATAALREEWEAPAAGPTPDRFAVEHGLYWHVAELSESRPLLLLVDDAQWADLASLRFLAHLAHRLGGLSVGLVIALREHADPERRELLDRLEVLAGQRCLGPAPLTADAVSAVLAGHLSVSPAQEFADACLAATGGIPLLVAALVAEIASAGIAPDADAAHRVSAIMPASVERWVGLRLARLPTEARQLAEAIAVVGPGIDLAWVAEVARLPLGLASSLADDLAQATVLTDRRPVAFAHPLIEAAVRDAIPAGRRAALHRAAYEVLLPAGVHRRRALNHALLCEPSGDAAMADALRAASRHADPRTAVAMLQRAARERPDAAEDPQLLQDLGSAQLTAGEDDGLRTLERARERTTDPRDRVAIDLQVGIARYERGELDAAASTLRRGGEEPLADDDELRVSLQAAEMTVVRSLVAPSEEQAAIGGRLDALLAERSPGRTSVERLVLAQAAFRGAQAGDVESSEVLGLGRRALPPSQDAPDRFDALALPLAAMAMYLSDEFEDVEARLSAEIERAQRQGEHMTYATASFFRGFPRYLRGDLLDAAADFQSALDAAAEGWAFALPSAHALRAMCAIERDELATAAQLLVLPGGDERWSTHPTFPVLLAIRALWHNCEGRHAEAAEIIAAAGARQSELGAVNPSALHWQVEAARTALARGDTSTAQSLSLEATQRARRFGAARALGLALRAAGMTHAGVEGVAYLRESVSVLEGSGAILELAHSRYALGVRLCRDGERGPALEALDGALQGAERCGGLRLRRLAAEQLAGIGARPRPAHLSGRESLTPTERQVALLAAEGVSNPHIAQRLFVTRRTVETHLSHAYAKLGVTGRDELAGALAGD